MEFIEKNPKIVAVFSVIYIIVVIIILSLIWKDDNKMPKEFGYNNMSEEQADIIGHKKYVEELTEAFQLEDMDVLLGKLSSNYKEFVGEYVEEEFNGIVLTQKVKVNEVKKYTDRTNNIYSANISFGGKTRQINIIEKYPNEYEYTFDDFYSYKKLDSNYNSSGLQIYIDSAYRKINQLDLNILLKNTSEKSVKFNMSEQSNVQAVLDDGKVVYISNIISSSESELDAGTSSNKKLVFNMSLDIQSKVVKIRFLNVDIEGTKKDIDVKIEV